MKRLIVDNRTQRPMDEILQHTRQLLRNNRNLGKKEDDVAFARFSDGVCVYPRP